MTSLKAEEIKNRLLEFGCLFAFEYKGTECNIDPFNPNDFHLMCGESETDVCSIDEVMSIPFFNGKCLTEIVDIISITDW